MTTTLWRDLQCHRGGPTKRIRFDLGAYVHEIHTKPCFLCEIVARNPEYDHHPVYEDEIPIAFLNKYPVLYDYTLEAQKAHRELVTGDFTAEEYLQLQRVIYRVAEPVRLGTGAERVYMLSLGSQQGAKHVHWHIASLPPGVPFEEQQLAALDIERGILDLSDDGMADLATRIRKLLDDSDAYTTC